MNFADYHAGTVRPGGHTWINHCRITNITNVPRGHVSVEDDSSLYIYKVPRAGRGAFKAWASDVFPKNGAKLLGSWPHYHVGPQP